MKKKYRYKNIFMYGSLQFCGHIDEYFASHTEKLVVYIIMPRVKNRGNLLRMYHKGKLKVEKSMWSSENIFLYYISWYVYYLQSICYYFSPSEPFVVLSAHPISFLGMTIQKMFRNITFAYLVGDYYPPTSLSLVLFEKLKKYYHDRISVRYYLSESINRRFNGRVKNDRYHRTVMWGVRPTKGRKRLSTSHFRLLFVGLIKEGQGLESLFRFLSTHKEYFVTIIGNCTEDLYKRYMKMIRDNQITKQVYFPNKFYLDPDLRKLAQTCHAGIALYDISPLSSSYYTDPGKVKSYAEMNLPIIMSNTTAVAQYIRTFHCGELVNDVSSDLEKALIKIKKHYSSYLHGLSRFNEFFYYDTYYKESFVGLESL